MSTPFTNELIHETSPYLLQHAHNPVNWYPWGPEALRLARQQNKPIFLSIGYAACHWCHVMEHESFEDEAVAEVLNEHFISVKVDREERPDLDEIYMNATILFTRGQGGWPMSVWLTPEGKPFYAGTYFPPQNLYGRPGFRTVLLRLAEIWREKSAAVMDDASKVTEILSQIHGEKTPGASSGAVLAREAVASVAQQIAGAFDPRQGGLASGSNKFPPSMAMELLLRENRAEPSPALLGVVELTLEKMARGGIYDHLGGGIHRYSTDSKWLVPHFEKMLYDQALVSSIYLDAFLLTGRKEFAETARGIFDYVLRNLRSPEGGLYSTEDADSEGKEGLFYIWTWEQVLDALGDDDGALFASFYDVTATGNWDHPGDAHVPEGAKNILRVLRPVEEAARIYSMPPAELERRLAAGREKLFAVRERRIHPGLDDKILAAWNGLMIASLAKGAAVFPEPEDAARYRAAAVSATEFVLSKMQQDGRLLRSYRHGHVHLMAYIDDFAFLIEGLLGLYEINGDLRWLNEAERLTE
ncbi:MAG: thioredoxin domain-containing protein, partial [Acidobacteria bacterium]|nr:thioredoxin domain-containing protein [Acidobacteriota bacterium]